MIFKTIYGRNIWTIEIDKRKKIALHEPEGYQHIMVGVDIDPYNEVSYSENYDIADMHTPHIKHDGINVMNPFLDEDRSHAVNPIVYYGEKKFYKWLTKLIMETCRPENLVR